MDIVLKFKGGKHGKMWILEKDIKHVLHNGDTVTIPKGMSTDLSSVPKFLWSFLPPFGNFILAPLIHDYLYVIDKSRGRKFADKEMLIVSNKTNKNKIDNYTRFVGVRLFGWIFWRYVDL